MHKKETALPQSIADLLAAQTPQDTGEAIARALHAWHRLAAHLTPYIGEAGFCALYGRALRLARPEFGWLTIPQPGASVQILFDSLQNDLTKVDMPVAGQAHFNLLEIFTTLLATLIGEVLATRILNSAWINESDAKKTQEKSK